MTIAAVFPGQGSQSPGMLAELAAEYPVIKDIFSQASDVLGYDAWDLSQNGSVEKLGQTEFTQPLMFLNGYALWRVWQQLDAPVPMIMAGHSLGEYTALVAAGALSFENALPLVELRGRLMANAVAPGLGGMAAVLGMQDAAVVDLCKTLSKDDHVVEAVNFNSPGQVVISGHLKAVETACTAAKEKGARRAMMLPVSVPNHSSLMQPAQAPLAAAIDKARLRLPGIPVMQNADATIPADLETLSGSLKRHVVNPVQWTATIQKMKDLGITSMVELGPGKVLAGLCKRIDKTIASFPIDTPAALDNALAAMDEELTPC